jgi:hypothetical protein
MTPIAKTYKVEFCSEAGYRGIYGYGRATDLSKAVEIARESLESKGYRNLEMVAAVPCAECF